MKKFVSEGGFDMGFDIVEKWVMCVGCGICEWMVVGDVWDVCGM